MDITGEFEIIFIGFIFEVIITLLFWVLLGLILKHYNQRKTVHTRLMFYIFLCFSLSVFFSAIAKLSVLLLESPTFEEVDPNISSFWILSRIIPFRISFALISIAAFLNYILKAKIFEERRNKAEYWIAIIFSLITIIFSLIFVDQEKPIFDLITFALVFLLMLLVYVPFIMASLKIRKNLHESVYRNASLSLAIMAMCFILTFLWFLLDRIMIVAFDSTGYTIFYFFGFSSTIIGAFFTYLGYIRPGQKQILTKELEQT